MKTLSTIMFVMAVTFMQACGDANNDNSDSVDSAQAINEERDTTAVFNEDVADFAVKAANSGMMEVELGKLASKKATNKAVKDFAAMMVKDHTKANTELKALAKTKNIALPATVGDDLKEKMNDLSEKTGKEFDNDYIDRMVSAHKDDVSLFERQADNGKDSAFAQWARKTLPKLRAHLEQVQAIDEKQD
jgi:putative membrane protein